MPRNAQGEYYLPLGTLVTSGQTVLVSQHNPAMEDIAQSLTNSLARDGRGGMTGALKMGGQRITGLAPGVNPTDAATVAQVTGGGGGTSANVFFPIANVAGDGQIINGIAQIGVGTDYDAQIQAAIDQASVNGGVIWVPQGVFRTTASTYVITSSDVHFMGPGTIFFDTDDIEVMGRIFYDGGTGSGFIERVSVCNIGLIGRDGLHCTGLFIDGVYTVDPSQPGYDGSTCLLTLRGVRNFLVDNVTASHSPNYVFSGLRCEDGTFSNNRLSYGTAAIQCQDGSKRLKYIGNHVTETSDDGLAYGYWGAQNDGIEIIGNTVYTTGARAIVVFGNSNAIIANNIVKSTFLAAILIEANAKVPANRINRTVVIMGNQIEDAGMYVPTGFARGADVAQAIRVNTAGGEIGLLTVIGNQMRNSANYHFSCEGSGSVKKLIFTGNICDGIGKIITTGNEIDAPSGGGKSLAPPDNYFPSVKINNVELVIFGGNVIRTGHEDGAYISPVAQTAHVNDNTFENLNARIDGGPAFPSTDAIISDAQHTYANDNTLLDSPSTTNLYDVANPIGPLTGAVIPRMAVTVSDNFDRANVAPVSGGLGNTPVGGKTWVGNPAGITGNQAYFGAVANQAVVFDAGTSDVDISVTALSTGAGQRLIARANSASPATGAAVILDASSGNLIHYNGTSNVAIVPFVPVTPNTTNTLRLRVSGNTAVAYVNGGIVAILKSNFPTTNFVGFQDLSAGLGRFDNFTMAPVPAAVVTLPTWQQIATAPATGVTTITFTSVPQSYEDLKIDFSTVEAAVPLNLSLSLSANGTTWIGPVVFASTNNTSADGTVTIEQYRKLAGSVRAITDNFPNNAATGFGSGPATSTALRRRTTGAIVAVRFTSSASMTAGTITLSGK